MLNMSVKRFIIIFLIFSMVENTFSKDSFFSYPFSNCSVTCSESGICMMIATSIYLKLEYNTKVSQYEGTGYGEEEISSVFGYGIFYRNDYPNLYDTIMSYIDIKIINKYGEFIGLKPFPWGKVENSIPYYDIQDSHLTRTICSSYHDNIVNDSLVNCATPFLVDFARDLEENKRENGLEKILPFAYDCVDKQSSMICRSFNWINEKFSNMYDSINIVINPFGFHRVNLFECNDASRILTIVGCLPYFEEDLIRCEYNTFDIIVSHFLRKKNKSDDESILDALGVCYYLDYYKEFYGTDLYEKERARIMKLIDSSAPDPTIYKNFLNQYEINTR